MNVLIAELINFSKVVAFIFIFCYLPAENFLSAARFSETGWKRLAVGTALGIAFMILVAYFCALLQLRSMVPFLLIVMSLIALQRRNEWNTKLMANLKGPHLFLLFFVILFSVPVITSGWKGDMGYVLRGVNNYDGVWNVALSRELKEHFPPQHPAIAGELIRGYHYFYNFWVAEISRIAGVNIPSLHFHYIALLLSFLLVYGIYMIGFLLTGRESGAKWTVFFSLAAGSFSFVLPLFLQKNFSLDDAFGITQPLSLLVSPSFTLSLILLIFFILILEAYIFKPNFPLGAALVVIGGVLIGIKIYAAFILLPVLFFYALFRAVKKRRLDLLIVCLVILLISFIVFYPTNASYGFLIFLPFWPLSQLMQGNLSFTNWELKRQTLVELRSYLGIAKLYAIAFAVFVLGNLGTRSIGILALIFSKRQPSRLMLFIIFASLISFVLPMFYIQPIGVFNMIQVYWYFLVLTGLLAGAGIDKLYKVISRWAKLLIILAIVALALPSAFEKEYGYIKNASYIPKREYDLYENLASQGKYSDVVLEIPRLQKYDIENLRAWFFNQWLSPPKIPAFGAKQLYVGNEIVQFPYDKLLNRRIDKFALLMNSETQEEFVKILRELYQEYSIRYIVSYNPIKWLNNNIANSIYRNDYGEIYELLPM